MLLSNAVMYFIILATAATLFKAGQTNIQSATDAAGAQASGGRGASILLAFGLIGSGLLAVPILTGSSAYALTGPLGEIWLQSKTLSSQTLLWRDYRFYFDRSGD